MVVVQGDFLISDTFYLKETNDQGLFFSPFLRTTLNKMYLAKKLVKTLSEEILATYYSTNGKSVTFFLVYASRILNKELKPMVAIETLC